MVRPGVVTSRRILIAGPWVGPGVGPDIWSDPWVRSIVPGLVICLLRRKNGCRGGQLGGWSLRVGGSGVGGWVGNGMERRFAECIPKGKMGVGGIQLEQRFPKGKMGVGEVSWVDGVRGGVVECFPKGKMGVRGS